MFFCYIINRSRYTIAKFVFNVRVLQMMYCDLYLIVVIKIVSFFVLQRTLVAVFFDICKYVRSYSIDIYDHCMRI